jgi:hypothetical protein
MANFVLLALYFKKTSIDVDVVGLCGFQSHVEV